MKHSLFLNQSTLSNLSTAEQMDRNFSSGTPQTANIPSSNWRWLTCKLWINVIITYVHLHLQTLQCNIYWQMEYEIFEFCQVVCSEFFNRTTELSTIIGQVWAEYWDLSVASILIICLIWQYNASLRRPLFVHILFSAHVHVVGFQLTIRKEKRIKWWIVSKELPLL